MTAEEAWSHRFARHLEESESSDDYYGDRSPSPRRYTRDDSDVYVVSKTY